MKRAKDKKEKYQEQIKQILSIVNAYLPEGKQRDPFKKQAVAPRKKLVEMIIGKSQKVKSSNSPSATSLICVNKKIFSQYNKSRGGKSNGGCYW